MTDEPGSNPPCDPSSDVELTPIHFIDEEKAIELLNIFIERVDRDMCENECNFPIGDCFFDTEWRHPAAEDDFDLVFVYQQSGQPYYPEKFESLEEAIVHAVKHGRI